MNNDIIIELVKAVSELKAVVEKAHTELGIDVLNFYELGCNDMCSASVHISHHNWESIGGWEHDWCAGPFWDKDADEPIEERIFKVWFRCQGVEVFTLTPGANVLPHLGTVPVAQEGVK